MVRTIFFFLHLWVRCVCAWRYLLRLSTDCARASANKNFSWSVLRCFCLFIFSRLFYLIPLHSWVDNRPYKSQRPEKSFSFSENGIKTRSGRSLPREGSFVSPFVESSAGFYLREWRACVGNVDTMFIRRMSRTNFQWRRSAKTLFNFPTIVLAMTIVSLKCY